MPLTLDAFWLRDIILGYSDYDSMSQDYFSFEIFSASTNFDGKQWKTHNENLVKLLAS